MVNYEVEIVYGKSFLNDAGKSVYGDNLSRKVILKGEAYTRSIAVSTANIEFGVEFSAGISVVPTVFIYKVSNHCSLVLRVKE